MAQVHVRRQVVHHARSFAFAIVAVPSVDYCGYIISAVVQAFATAEARDVIWSATIADGVVLRLVSALTRSDCICRFIYLHIFMSVHAMPPNQSPEPTTIGAFRDSARVAGCWMSIVRGGSAPNVRLHLGFGSLVF